MIDENIQNNKKIHKDVNVVLSNQRHSLEEGHSQD